MSVIPVLAEQTRIPKVIHQTYRSLELPQELSSSIAQMRAANPGWDYRFYDDSDIASFIAQNFGDDILQYYYRIAPDYAAARADFFRYLLIYHEGGVYLDIKSSLSRPLDEIVQDDDRFLLAQWPIDDPRFGGWGNYPELRSIGGREFQQWNIIAAPGHPFLREVLHQVIHNIDNYVPELHGVGAKASCRVSGPVPYTLSIHPMLHHCAHRMLGDHVRAGLIYSIYDHPNAHRSTLIAHYSTKTTPVIVLQGRQLLVSKFLGALQRQARRLLRRGL